MRYAIFGDIHGNTEALRVVQDDMKEQEVDQTICLGDVVGYGAEPVKCLEMVMEMGCDCIAGNHDWAAIERISIDFFNAYAKAAAIWTREQLTPEHKEWRLADLPLTKTYEHFAVAHGTFHQPEAFNYIQTVFDAQLSFEALGQLNSKLGFGMLLHRWLDSDPITYTPDPEIPVDINQTIIINAGWLASPVMKIIRPVTPSTTLRKIPADSST